ncbi:MAG: alpha/beta fold hydrolase [Candidatus Dormibacteraeota bacterium]|uniref:Alpha/beta fold hydrolase n=1 Tax=Candidatus Amunia macphersoniae TaxID=3127014 RepID=A0A934KGD0_9BACT|nr:alpha/beta fold hydrolase [Candidatus Dormibacteraeota bacterium]
MLPRFVGDVLEAVQGVAETVQALPRAAGHVVRAATASAVVAGHDEPLPPGLIIPVPGHGEMFVRDTHPQGGGERGTLLLLHGWLAASDTNWWSLYEPLRLAGWRVLAVDARGHGRGLRAHGAFRLSDCAEDCAALLQILAPGPVVVVGYSMGGAIAQILAHRHPEMLRGMVLVATAAEWRAAPQLRAAWYLMGAMQLGWRLTPRRTWSELMNLMYGGKAPQWFAGELARGAPWDIAEAGREMGRYDARGWLREVRVPAAVIATTEDVLVPVSRQLTLARALGAPVIEIDAGHLVALTNPRQLNGALQGALEIVAQPSRSRRRASGDPAAAVPLARGDHGEDVANAQRLLSAAGDSCGQIDGIFGPATAAAVSRFQRSKNLKVTGRIDRATWPAIAGVPRSRVRAARAELPPEQFDPPALVVL